MPTGAACSVVYVCSSDLRLETVFVLGFVGVVWCLVLEFCGTLTWTGILCGG